MEITFKSDTSYRKGFFVPESFSHPAKMVAPLLLWIVERYTEPGQTILDPMGGSGTTMLACPLGRNVVMVELEEKFCQLQRDNWEKSRQMPRLGYDMGTCTILQGDARNLKGLFDSVITSPPYTNRMDGGNQLQPGFVPYSGEADGWFTTRPNGNIGNLKYGKIDAVVSSPPYEEAMGDKHHSPRADILAKEKANPVTYTDRVDAVVTSPPYEGIYSAGHRSELGDVKAQGSAYQSFGETTNVSNIGNLKSSSYLESMLLVYQQCHKVLRDGGIMVLVTKDFIRDQKRIDLAGDTIRLCEEAGFTFLERHYRKLTAVSFWRTIYKQRYPDAPEINTEDILVFRK